MKTSGIKWMHLFFKRGGIGSVLFVLVVMSASAYAATCGGFDDVDASDPYCAAVERIRDAGITEGCNPPANTRYCPDGVVTRGQMAT
ncbi:MAG: S-layer homology domain-containing protein, partial [Desulfobacterales bacterium]